jgi:putative transcriptional regulator
MTNSNLDLRIRVREIREQLNLTQEGMAEELGVSFATVNRWENGWTLPSKLAMRQIDLLCKKHRLTPLTDTTHVAKY